MMEGLHAIPRPEWAARYAAELLRRGAGGSLKDLVADGCRLWLTAGPQSPESVALLHWRMRAAEAQLAGRDPATGTAGRPCDPEHREGEPA